MATNPQALAFIHAHPDDECILTGATLAKASSAGIRTIVAYATQGDAGQTSADLGTESLGARRVREAEAACAVLGVDRIVWLDHADSGMAGTETADHPAAFCNTDPEAVAADLADRLADEDIYAVIGYDSNGTYGHPDHRQVHAVAHAFAERLGASWVLDATYNREYLATLPDADGNLDPTFACAEAELTHVVYGEPWVRSKIEALMHHQSQIPDDWDRDNPDIDGFRLRFGAEWYVAQPVQSGPAGADLGPLAEVIEPKKAWVPPPTTRGTDGTE